MTTQSTRAKKGPRLASLLSNTSIIEEQITGQNTKKNSPPVESGYVSEGSALPMVEEKKEEISNLEEVAGGKNMVVDIPAKFVKVFELKKRYQKELKQTVAVYSPIVEKYNELSNLVGVTTQWAINAILIDFYNKNLDSIEKLKKHYESQNSREL